MTSLILTYFSVGVICGFVSEEINFQASSNCDRSTEEYVFSAVVYSMFWPLLLSEIKRRNPS